MKYRSTLRSYRIRATQPRSTSELLVPCHLTLLESATLERKENYGTPNDGQRILPKVTGMTDGGCDCFGKKLRAVLSAETSKPPLKGRPRSDETGCYPELLPAPSQL